MIDAPSVKKALLLAGEDVLGLHSNQKYPEPLIRPFNIFISSNELKSTFLLLRGYAFSKASDKHKDFNRALTSSRSQSLATAKHSI